MKIKGFFAALLCFALIFAALEFTSASAAEATYKMSSQYKESKYYNNFSAVSLTGDQASDVLAVALSQLGYREGDSNEGLGGTAGGDRDFVEFNVLYGKIDNNQGNGLSYGYYWCASFVNWCLREANVSKEASATGEISCRRWLSACKSAGIYLEKTEIPISGDLIFFKDAGSEVSSTHMGIVRYCDGARVYTVEGNTVGEDYSSDGDRVALKSYPLTSSYIVGYARPKYERTADARVDHTGKSFTKGLYISKQEIELFDDANMTSSAGSVGENEVFYVTDLKDNIAKISYQSGCEIYEGYADIFDKAIQLNSTESACRISYLDEDGSALLPPSFADKGEAARLSAQYPSAEKRGLAGWAKTPDAEAPEFFVGDEFIAEGDTTLYALWDYTRYETVFLGFEGEELLHSFGYLGESLTPPELSAPEGYIFTGWGEGFLGRVTGNATYTAQFEKISDETEAISVAATSEEDSESITEANGGSGEGYVDIFATLGCRAGANSLAVIFFTLAGALCVLKKRRKCGNNKV